MLRLEVIPVYIAVGFAYRFNKQGQTGLNICCHRRAYRVINSWKCMCVSDTHYFLPVGFESCRFCLKLTSPGNYYLSF